MKKAYLILIIAILIVSSAIIYFFKGSNSDASKPEEVVNSYIEKVQNYKNPYEGINKSDMDNMPAGDIKMESLKQKIYSQIEYKVGKIEKSKDTAKVTISVTSIDMADLTEKANSSFINYIKGLQNIDFKSDYMLKYAEGLESILTSGNIKKVTEDSTITLVLQGKEWKVKDSSSLDNALSGGLQEVINKNSSSYYKDLKAALLKSN